MQAERKALPSTLTPDMDNAIVGSHNTVDFTEISIEGISVFCCIFLKRGAVEKIYSGRGGAPCAFRKAMGTCVSG